MLSRPRWLSFSLAAAVLVATGGCDRQPASGPEPGADGSEHAPQVRPRPDSDLPAADVAAEVAVVEARCLACHAADPAVAERIGPRAAPSLANVASRAHPDWIRGFLGEHGVGSAAEAADLVAYLRAETGGQALAGAEVSAGELQRGAELLAASACQACHGDGDFADLGQKTDLDHLAAFLVEPRRTRPDLTHDFTFTAAEARSLAAHLLRDTIVDAAEAEPLPGLAWECFEMDTDGEIPDLEGRVPAASGIRGAIDTGPRTRDQQYALRYRGQLRADKAGEYEFVVGSDDGSWLWIDDEMIVENGGNKPHRRRSGKVQLTAGWHDFLLIFTQAGGGQSLEAEWRVPGGELVTIPEAALSGRVDSLAPPAAPAAAPDPAAVERGREAFAAKRCNACHATEGLAAPSLDGVPAWGDLAGTSCPTTVVPGDVDVGATPTGERSPYDELAFRMRADDCLRCHVRDGRGGLSDAARRGLVEVADLGDEGVLPPDLTAVGLRLRPEWIRSVLADGADARDYVLARCVRIPVEEAAAYAELFDAIDAAELGDAVDAEPEFSAAAVVRGKDLVGSAGKACIACHGAVGRPSIGARGMDLSMQAERLRPYWFREWLLRPLAHRPGTRMPTFWPEENDEARADVDAIRVWVDLGNAAPIPAGLVGDGAGDMLEVGERPRLHGAFLAGLSAKCLAVGTDLRTHYAYDLRHARLAWLWRGEFMSAAGTWNGRAGKLIEPAGTDWVVLDENPQFTAVDGDAVVRVVGRRVDEAGYPTFVLALGDARIEDQPRPRFASGGTELVRTIRVTGGAVRLALPPAGGDVEAVLGTASGGARRDGDAVQIDDGATIEVIYRW